VVGVQKQPANQEETTIMRKRYDKACKAKVALEALRGDKTVQERASLYEVHPNMVPLWKKQILEGAEVLFEKPGKDTERHELEQKQDELYKQIGKLQIENDFLKKSTNNCPGSNRRYRVGSSRIINTRAMKSLKLTRFKGIAKLLVP
jgi:transposase